MDDDFEVTFTEDTNQETPQYSKGLYKKWFKAGGQAGFISIEPWLSAQKFVVDIGKIDPSNNSVVSNTKCYVDAIALLTYLNEVVAGRAEVLFPERGDCPSKESFVVYGGSAKADPVVARVFKIHWWGAKKDAPGNPSGFAWKCGQFEGQATDTGAIKPKYDKPISADLIRVSRVEMHEICVRLALCLQGYAAKFNDWYG